MCLVHVRGCSHLDLSSLTARDVVGGPEFEGSNEYDRGSGRAIESSKPFTSEYLTGNRLRSLIYWSQQVDVVVSLNIFPQLSANSKSSFDDAQIARQRQESVDVPITKGHEDGSCLWQCPGVWPNYS